jgi:hydrogenase maturation factor
MRGEHQTVQGGIWYPQQQNNNILPSAVQIVAGPTCSLLPICATKFQSLRKEVNKIRRHNFYITFQEDGVHPGK